MPIQTNPWPKYPLLYEINTRVWLTELSARYNQRITLDRIPAEELERIARLGFHAVWLMGVWTTGPGPIEIARTHPGLEQEYRRALSDYTSADCIGSPYAVSAYEVAAWLGGPGALAVLRERMARQGLRLMLDFVPNHLACDHVLTRTRPEVFVCGGEDDLARDRQGFFKAPGGAILAHARDPNFPPWSDTVQLNYAQRPGREMMLETLLALSAQCDGLRCDMAMLILPDIQERIWGARLGPNRVRQSFWKDAIPAVLARSPNFVFLAESYWDRNAQLEEEGFHYTYDKTLYDRVLQGDVSGVQRHLRGTLARADRRARFLENHDEPRAATAFGPARARSTASAVFFVPGLKLFHEGQLEGRRVRVPVQLRRRPAEREDAETALAYEKVLEVLRDPIFQTGKCELRTVNSAGFGDSSHASLLALAWTPQAARRSLGYLIVTNLGGLRGYARLPLPAAEYAADKSYVFYDYFDGKRYEREGRELIWPGLYVALEGHQAHLFEVTPK